MAEYAGGRVSLGKPELVREEIGVLIVPTFGRMTSPVHVDVEPPAQAFPVILIFFREFNVGRI